MRNNFLQPDWISQDLDSAHSLPISQMGNYQEYLKKQTPQLREIESAPVRQHMFGNPFKIDKRMMVDEADFDIVGSPSGTNRNNKRSNPNSDMGSRLHVKRKPGPLPKKFSIRRRNTTSDVLSLPSPPLSPQPSPIPWLNTIEKELPRFEEPPNVITNGLDSPSSSERSRSPSPTLELPSFDLNYSNSNTTSHSIIPIRNNINYSPTGNTQNDTITLNSYDFYNVQSSMENTNKEISQILKETSYNHNSHPVETTNNFLEKEEKKPEIIENEVNKEEIDSQNFEIRKNLNRLVRKPGKNFTELFESIKTLKGDIDAQVEIVKLVIKESLRFKRQQLAKMLEEHIQNMMTVENK